MRLAMSSISKMLARGGARCVLTAVLLVVAAKAPAQNLDLEQRILKALTPTPTVETRSLTTTPRDTSQTVDRQFLDTLKNRTTHSLTADERERLATIAKERPSIDIEINFDYGSDKVGPAATPSLTALGKALTNPDLKGNTFVLAGHTDAKGGIPFNQELSEKRADAVKRYLVDHFQIPAPTLVTVGYGKTKLKNESDPFAAENRRVQIVNMEEKSVSQR